MVGGRVGVGLVEVRVVPVGLVEGLVVGDAVVVVVVGVVVVVLCITPSVRIDTLGVPLLWL